jgi:hypothetical protein
VDGLTRFDVEIDRLVVHGRSKADAARIEGRLKAELERLLREDSATPASGPGRGRAGEPTAQLAARDVHRAIVTRLGASGGSSE